MELIRKIIHEQNQTLVMVLMAGKPYQIKHLRCFFQPFCLIHSLKGKRQSYIFHST